MPEQLHVVFTDTVEYDLTIELDSWFPERIETDRLVMRGPIGDNGTLEDFHSLHSGESGRKIAPGLDFTQMDTVEESAELMADLDQRWRDGEAAYYLIFEKDATAEYDPEFCGVGLLDFQWARRSVILGVWLHPAVWGNGYSAERAEALLDVVFNSPAGDGVDVVNIFMRVDNEQSVAAVEEYVGEFGGRRVGRIANYYNLEGVDEVKDHYLFQIERDDYWKARRSTPN